MKKVISLIVAVVLVLSLVPVASAKTIDGAQYGSEWSNYKFTILDQDTSILAPGITQDIVYAKMHRTGNQTVYYMAKANPQDEYVEIHANYKDNQCDEWGMQKVTDQMKAAEAKHQATNPNYKAVVGINVDTYDMSTGAPHGALVMEEKTAQTNNAGYPMFLAILKDGTAKICFNLADWNTLQQDANNPIVEAVGGWHKLIVDGNIVNSNWGNENARTAIGVTANNEVVVLMVDGKQLPFSGGADMLDMAVILKEAGCVNAFNVDGGGSSTYAAREVGSDEIEVVNRPCDGYERIVSSSLMFVSTAPDSNEFSRAKLDPEFNDITPNTSVNIEAIGTTFGGTPIDIPDDAVWEVEPSTMGTVQKTTDGAVFTAGETTGTAIINLKYKDTVAGTVTINVVKPDSFKFALPSYGVPYGKSLEIETVATFEERRVGLNENDLTFSLTNDQLGKLERKTGSNNVLILTASGEPESGEAPTGKIQVTLHSGKDGKKSITADIILGRESKVIFDFETEEQAKQFEGVVRTTHDTACVGKLTADVKWVTSDNGMVHDGKHALKATFDYSHLFEDSFGSDCIQTYLKYTGQDISLDGAIGIGMWVWYPEEDVNSSSFINTSYGTAMGHERVGSNYDDGNWYYIYQDLTKTSGQKFTAKNIFSYLIWQSEDNPIKYFNTANRYTLYFDDISVDYSLVSPDRDTPEIKDVTSSSYSGTLDRDSIAKFTDAGSVSFQAKVNEPVNSNTSGINKDSLVATIDGVEISAEYSDGMISTSPVKLAKGIHTLRLFISDNANNTGKIMRRFEVTGESDDVTVTVTPHGSTEEVKIGSIFYVDVTATDISKINSVSMDLDLSNNSTWELDHLDINPKFESKWEYKGWYGETENIVTVTFTRKDGANWEDGDKNLIASLPIRTWEAEVEPFEKYSTKAPAPSVNSVAEAIENGMYFPVNITADVDRGEITFTDDYTSETKNTFSGARITANTELDNHPRYNDGATAHVHDTELQTEDKEATCYENGYTNRQICPTCGSVVNDEGWGTVVPALEHEYTKGEDNILKCEHCEKTFTGVFTDGKTYTNGVMQKDGWTEDDRYFVDGKPLTGVQEIEGKYHDFGDDGVCEGKELFTGFFEKEDKQYYALEGVLQTGWFMVLDTMYHALNDGAVHTTTMEDTRKCTTNGYKIYTCTVCPVDPETGLRPQFQSEALWWEGHTWDDNYHCTVCGAVGKNIADCELQIQGKYFDYRGPGVNVEASHRVIDEAAGGRWLYLNSDRRGVDGYSEFFNCADIGHAKVIVHGRGEYYGDIEGTYDIVPQSVKSVTATEVGQDGEHTSVKLTWEAPLGAEYYGVYKFDTAKNDWVKLEETEETTYTIDGLSIGESYRFRVASRAVRNNEVFACTTWSYAEGTVEHNWVEDTEQSIAPTCDKPGTSVRTCSVCGKTEKVDIPALGHEVAEWETVTPPTTTSEGLRTGHCSRCEQEVEETIPVLPPVQTGSGANTNPSNKTETVTNEDGSTTTTTTKPDGSKTETTTQTDGTVTEKNTEKSGVVTETTTKPDNTVTEKVTQTDGSATEKTTTPDGVVGQKSTDAEGKVTSAEVVIPKEAEKQDVVTAPVEVPAAKSAAEAPEISVRTESSESQKVEIPVTEFGPGTVAVVVHEDGTEEIVRDCVMGENGVVLNVEGDVTLKIVDNTETFEDVEPANHWASNAVEFVAARELFNGTGENKFTPNGAMTRGMMVTVLYRLAYEPDTVAEQFADVPSGQYYSDAVAWAQNAGVVTGYDDNTFAPDDNVKREQLVTILYRYAKKMGYATTASGTLAGYADASSVSGWAADAMSWAIDIGLVNGVDATHLAPANNATRAEVATILMRFCEKVVK